MLLPIRWADAASVGGGEPAVPVEVAGTVLALAVDGLVKIFYDRGASRFREGAVRRDGPYRDHARSASGRAL